MKTTGAVNWFHALAWLAKHIEDAKRQGHFKETLEAKKSERKIWKIVRRARRSLREKVESNVARMALSPAAGEVSIDTAAAKSPPIGLGCIFCLEQPFGPMQPGSSNLDYWVRRGTGDLVNVLHWKESMLRWHAGYLSSKFERYRDGSVVGELDERLIEGTVTTPQWDSDALSESIKTGEIPSVEFIEFLERIASRFKAEEGHISCGAPQRIRLVGINVHPQDGTLHLHPLFLRTEPLGFLRQDGTIVPAALAPNGGRRKKGEGWLGGERCGLIGDGGQLVTNPLGVALCASDSERFVGIAPPRENGTTWDFLEGAIRVREKGDFVEGGKRAKRKRSVGLGPPYDLVYTRIVRDEILALAAKFPAFATRRAAKIEEAKAARLALNARIVEFAAPEIDAARKEGERQGREAERKNASVERAREKARPGPDRRTMISMMGDALRRALAGIQPTPTDMIFIKKSCTSIGGYTLKPKCWDELGEAQSDPSCRDVVETTRSLAAATEFTEFAAAKDALKSDYRSNPQFFDEDGNLTRGVARAAKAAATLGLLIDHPLYCPAWAEWGRHATALLESSGSGKTQSREEIDIEF